MDLLDQVEHWWRSNEAALRGDHIDIAFKRGLLTANPACHLVLRRLDREAELLAWRSGEVDANKGHLGRTVDQRHISDIAESEGLDAVLSDLVEFVTARARYAEPPT